MTNNLLSFKCCYMRKIVIIILVGVSALFGKHPTKYILTK